ncbi:basal-body rod modification protein FlgD [Desulfosarcina alkanivorans]|uniref:Basal-body rod modification protein FlgD n=1 Tax=Desulfosarcina alkanivorans TaxID=571177 RepID=A0A5K7YKE0_9BACT|nr:flagellar hook capping FlgD N-terminal domain-containing protein [Desulfosarcina alkanivorans]BBO66764.1 basal-body rod modification protein FlgD [Desulfosarcina alkanivorans]
MTVMSVSDVYSQASTPQTQDNSVMGKEDFLTLLVAQLQHQDPLNPSESTEFTAQLAQFSSLEQLQNIDATLNGFEVYQSTLNNIESSGFIGKTVTAAGSMIAVNDGTPDPIRFDLANGAESVYVQVYDGYGDFVTDIQAGALPAGEQQMAWDGEDSTGAVVEDGIYTFTVMAMNTNGDVVHSTSYTTGTVTGIDYKSGATKLLMNDREIPISSVIRIEETPSEENSQS